MSNDGDVAWPEGTKIQFVGGDNMFGSPIIQSVDVPVVEPQASVTVEVSLKAPSDSGHYVSFWRLVAPDGARFGHRVWCDIIVSEESTPTFDDTASVETTRSQSTSSIPRLSSISSSSSVSFSDLDRSSPLGKVSEKDAGDEFTFVSATTSTGPTTTTTTTSVSTSTSTTNGEEEKEDLSAFEHSLQMLTQMGFVDDRRNIEVLKRTGGSLEDALAIFLSSQ